MSFLEEPASAESAADPQSEETKIDAAAAQRALMAKVLDGLRREHFLRLAKQRLNDEEFRERVSEEMRREEEGE